MNPTKAILPYTTDSEYIEAEHRHLVAKAARLSLQRRLDQDTGPGAIAIHRQWPVDDAYIASVRQRLVEAEVVERGLRDQIDERLAVHRGTEGVAVLDLDALCDEHDLTEDERLVLIIATVVAVSGHHADTVNDALAGSRHFSQTVDDMITMLDPRDVAEAVRARLIFRPEAPLLANGLIEVEVQPAHTTPSDLLDARVSITFAALGVITGVPELAEADWSHSTTTPETTPAT